MKIDELKLNKFNHYKSKNTKFDKHFIFCIVYDLKDNEILEVRERFSKKTFNLNEFIQKLNSNKNSLRKKIEFYYLPISNEKQILKDFNIFKINWYKLREELKEEGLLSKIFFKLKSFLKNYYKSLLIFLFAIYSAFFYYALSDIGIPLTTINIAMQELLSIMLYYLSGPILLIINLSLMVFLFYLLVFLFFKLIAIIILKYMKKPTIYFDQKEIGFMKYLYNACINTILICIILIYLLLLFFPFAHITYDVALKLKPFRADKYQPDYLYYEYLNKVGYPKIAIENEKYYILVGHDKSYEYMYDLNLSKQYIKKDEKSKAYEQFCRNIMEDKSKKNITYEFIRNSPYITAYNTKQVKIKDSNFTYKSLAYIVESINLEKTKQDCEVYIKNKALHVKEKTK